MIRFDAKSKLIVISTSCLLLFVCFFVSFYDVYFITNKDVPQFHRSLKVYFNSEAATISPQDSPDTPPIQDKRGNNVDYSFGFRNYTSLITEGKAGGGGEVRSVDFLEEESSGSKPKKRNAIAILTNNLGHECLNVLRNIQWAFQDLNQADIILFHSDYPRKDFRYELSKNIMPHRKIQYVNVDQIFNSFPPNFNPYSSEPNTFKYMESDRHKWAYQHMIRFWFRDIFRLPILDDVEYLMRLDLDSRLLGKWPDIFRICRDRNLVYYGNDIIYDSDWILKGTALLKPTTVKYMEKKNITPKYPELWNQSFIENDLSVRGFFNNFEVSQVSFFRQPEIQDWVDYIDQSLGIFHYRWGDALLRSLTLALFAEKGQVNERYENDHGKLPYCHPWPYECRKYENIDTDGTYDT